MLKNGTGGAGSVAGVGGGGARGPDAFALAAGRVAGFATPADASTTALPVDGRYSARSSLISIRPVPTVYQFAPSLVIPPRVIVRATSASVLARVTVGKITRPCAASRIPRC